MAAGVTSRVADRALGIVPSPRVHPSPLGGAASAVWLGHVDDDDENTKTRGELWRGTPGTIGESQKMLTDPHVRTGRDVVVDPVVAAEWDIEAGGKRPADLEAARFARRAFVEQVAWKRHVGEVMRAYWSDGFAVVETTTDIVPLPRDEFPLHPLGGHCVAPTGLYVRPGWSIDGWYQHQRNASRIRGVRQYLQGSDVEPAGFVDIPADRLLRFTWEQTGANYEGNAPQRSVWGPWHVKRLLTRIEAMGHERNHLAAPIGKRDTNAGSEDGDKKLLRILENFRAHEKGAIVLEPGYTIEWSQHGQQTNIGATIQRCNFDIAHGGQSGFMLLGQAEGPGSYALAGTQKGQFDISLGKHADFICDVYNFGLDDRAIIAEIVRANYGPDVAVPRLVVRYLPTVNWAESLPVAKDLVGAGVIKSDARLDAWARRGLKAPEAEPESDRTKDPREASENIGAGNNIQQQLPNGAQVTAGAAIVSQVARGEISRESGRALLIQFFGVASAIAEEMLGPPGFTSVATSAAAAPVLTPANEEAEQ